MSDEDDEGTYISNAAMQAYLRAACETSLPDDDDRMPTVNVNNAGIFFSISARALAIKELRAFFEAAREALEVGGDALETELAITLPHGKAFVQPFDEKDLARDFWLTRNHHGTGFWDRPEKYGKLLGQMLTDIAHSFPERTVIETEEPELELEFL